MLPKYPIHIGRKPGLVAEFKCGWNSAWKSGDKHFQLLRIAFEERRQLIQDHTEAILQSHYYTQQVIQSFRRNFKPFAMCNLLRCLEGEAKLLGNRILPCLDGF